MTRNNRPGGWRDAIHRHVFNAVMGAEHARVVAIELRAQQVGSPSG
jgi:hypothetical protein